MGVRETKPFGVRMPDELKDELSREANINGRSLNQEIVARLKATLGQKVAVTPRNDYTVQSNVATGGYAPDINDIERQMLIVFRRFTPEKQLAMLSLFK